MVTTSFSLLPRHVDFIGRESKRLFNGASGCKSILMRKLIDDEMSRVKLAELRHKKNRTAKKLAGTAHE